MRKLLRLYYQPYYFYPPGSPFPPFGYYPPFIPGPFDPYNQYQQTGQTIVIEGSPSHLIHVPLHTH